MNSIDHGVNAHFTLPDAGSLPVRQPPPYNCRMTYATMRAMSGMNPAFNAQQPGRRVQLLLSPLACWLPPTLTG